MQTAPAGRQFMQGGTDMEKNITIRPERVSDYQQVEDIIRQAFYNLYTPGCTEHYLAHAIRPPPGFSAGVGPGAGAGRPCGRQYHVHEEHTGGRGREGEGHPDLWTSLYPTGTAAPGLWQAADGGVLPAGVRHGVRGYCDLRRSQQLRGPRLPKLQKAPGPSGGRDVSRRDAGEGTGAGTLAGKSWIYRQSPAFVFDEAEARRFDDSLPPMEKKRLPCQEAFEILSSAVLL